MTLQFDDNDMFGYYTMSVRVKEPRLILPDRIIGEQSTLYSITGERESERETWGTPPYLAKSRLM